MKQLIENAAAISPAVRALVGAGFRKAVSDGSPQPRHVLVEDESGLWKKQLRSWPRRDRQSTILVYFSASALDFAGRLGVGGALAVPPSVVMTAKSCLAAEAALSMPAPFLDPLLMDGRGEALHVSLGPEFLWRKLIGVRGIQELLLRLGGILDVPPILDAGPSLLIWEKTGEEIMDAWKNLDGRPVWSDWTLPVIDVPPVEEKMPKRVGGAVARLPRGEIVDYWSLACRAESAWQFRNIKGDIPECSNPDALGEINSPVFRVPSWVLLDLERIASPGERLLHELNRSALRYGKTPWVSGVGERTLVSLLALHSPVLIDGPVLSGL